MHLALRPDNDDGFIRGLFALYTYDTAYANFEEKIKGSVEVHKVADLVVLTKNLLQASPREILDTKVVMTIVGGKIVYGQ